MERYLYKSPNHVMNLNNMRLSKKLCDVTIKVDDSYFQAHKIILAANLKYFESMFFNFFEETKHDLIILIDDMEGADVEAFITFAYIGEILLTQSNVLRLLKVATHFHEDGIKEACIDFLANNLKVEEACAVYKCARTIGCLSLQNLARFTILVNFQNCSQTLEYFDFDSENLIDVLSDTVLVSCQSQQIFFEGVMQWILHDVRNRQIFIGDLLDCIEITELSTDYLLNFFYKSIKGQGDVFKDVMFFYHKKIQQRSHQSHLALKTIRQSLMLIGNVNDKLHVHIYNFAKKKWCEPYCMTYSGKHRAAENGTLLNNLFYYDFIDESSKDSAKIYLQVFNPSTQRSTVLASERILLRHSAMVACTRFIFFCGGQTVDGFASDQILKYTPQTNSFEILSPMKTKRWSAAAIFSQGSLYVLGGYDESSEFIRSLDSVEKYDFRTNQWTSLESMSMPRQGFGVSVLNEKIYICGGKRKKWDGWRKTVEVYDPSTNKWQRVASMERKRYKALMVAHEGKLLAVGGNSNNTVEVYDPIENQWQIDYELSSGLHIRYPTGGLIPSGCIFDTN